MNDLSVSKKLAIGFEFRGPSRKVTNERIEWYDSAMLSAAVGSYKQVGSNIHTDPDYAKAEGFPTVNADGMIMTNWCSEMLTEQFGMAYLEKGELRTKFIKPAYLGTLLHTRGRVRGVALNEAGGQVCDLEIWCEDDAGVRIVDGDAKVVIAP